MVQLITEKKLLRIEPVLFTTDGSTKGCVTVADTSIFRVGQVIVLKSATNGPTTLIIKRIINRNKIFVGDSKNINVDSRSDVSMFLVADGATIEANEQTRPVVGEQTIERNTYEDEPVVARRVVLVDKYGEMYDLQNPVPNIISDGTDTLAINPDGSINVNVLPTTNTPVIYKEHSTFTDDSENIVAIFTTTQNNTSILRLLGEAATYGVWKLYIDDVDDVNLFAAIRTSPETRTADLLFKQPEKIPVLGTNIVVTFQADMYRTRMLGATAKTFVRLEACV